MINKDLIKQESNKFMQDMSAALKAGDAEGAAKALQAMQEGICDAIEKEFEMYGNSDMAVLEQRGLRRLTSEENSWYQAFIGAVKTGTKQAITNIGSAIPPTVIDRVIEDMKKDHPLLDAIDITNAAGATKLVMNGIQMASKLGSWGAIGAAISQEIAGQVTIIDVTTNKYTAYFTIPKDFVKFNFSFAPVWVDQYIRAVLAESIAFGLESAIISGNGNGKPAGMTMDLSSYSSGYSAKTANVITNFGDDYAAVIKKLAVDGNGDYRNFQEVILVVNPKDAVSKVRAWQNAVTHAGIIDLISLTFPTKVVPSAMIAEGTAVVGIAKNYFIGINGGASGIVEFSDEAQFLNDARVYTTRVYGNGRPVDNTSFEVLTISGVAAPTLPVSVIGTGTTQASE